MVCNRCHYHQSVVLFRIETYEVDNDNLYREIPRYDGNLYIFHTCHKKLKKSQIPAQAV